MYLNLTLIYCYLFIKAKYANLIITIFFNQTKESYTLALQISLLKNFFEQTLQKQLDITKILYK